MRLRKTCWEKYKIQKCFSICYAFGLDFMGGFVIAIELIGRVFQVTVEAISPEGISLFCPPRFCRFTICLTVCKPCCIGVQLGGLFPCDQL